MDPLSDLLRIVRLEGAYFFAVEAAEPWSVETLAAKELSPRIMPGAEHLISYHILTEGRCYGGVVGEEQVELAPGDVIVFPHGDAHVMSSGRGVRVGPDVHSTAPARFPDTVVLGDGGPRAVSVVCGFLGCDRRPFNPLLAALPRRMHMRGMSSAWLGTFVRQVTEESRLGRAGADCVLTRLAELMFIEVLRRYLDDLPSGQTGWLAGLRDEVVVRALTLLHGRPAHSWTLADLAREAASSRSNLAKRFALLVGQPPMHYLFQWRIRSPPICWVRVAPRSPRSARRSVTTPRPRSAALSRRRRGLPPGPGARPVARLDRNPSRPVRSGRSDNSAGLPRRKNRSRYARAGSRDDKSLAESCPLGTLGLAWREGAP